MEIEKAISQINQVIKSVGSSQIEVIAVTKTVPHPRVLEAIRCGIKHIGENRIQEAMPKFEQMSAEIAQNGVKKHFLGHLQSNKVKKAVEHFDLIQSLDSLNLAQNIDKQASCLNKIQECLIEVKVSNELSKTGISPENVSDLYAQALKLPHLLIRGLMIIAPLTDTVEQSRPYFKLGYEFFAKLKSRDFNILSMGMSSDYKVALEEGATMIRIGAALFGERQTWK